MFKPCIGLIGLLFTQALSAQTHCVVPTLYDFTVYSIGDIAVQQSDYQGLTGAGGNLFAENFQFNSNSKNCLALAVGKETWIMSSFIHGNMESRGKVNMNSVGSSGNIVSPSANIISSGINESRITSENPEVYSSGQLPFKVNHPAVAAELMQESSRLSHIPSNSHVNLIDENTLTIDIKHQADIFYLLKPTDLSNAKRIIIRGDKSSSAAINVPGESLTLQNQDYIITGGMCPGNITWNFYQAKFLSVTHTHSALVGMPGIVMAPLARVEFNEALITGALYAGEISVSGVPLTHLNGGQVNNRGCPE